MSYLYTLWGLQSFGADLMLRCGTSQVYYRGFVLILSANYGGREHTNYVLKRIQ